MPATLMDILMILALGLLAGSGAGLFIGFVTGARREWDRMPTRDLLTYLLLIIACSATVSGFLAWYIFLFPAA